MGTPGQVDTSWAGLCPVKHSRSHGAEQNANARERQAHHHMRRQNSRAFAACSSIHDPDGQNYHDDDGACSIENDDVEDPFAPQLDDEDHDFGEDDYVPFEEPHAD